MDSIWWDAVQGGYRVRFRVINHEPGDEWSTIQTEPFLDVWSTRWTGETVEVMIPQHPPWQVDEEVTLTLQPYW